jgi:6,7-dimethyl-8-ribityllumazine synthase
VSDYVPSGEVPDATGLNLAVVRSRYNDHITSRLVSGAIAYLDGTGASYRVYEAPGTFELPLISRRVLDAGCDGVVALGAVIDGETDHYEHVAHRASEGLMRVMLDTGKPVAFGILTVRQEKHALVRSEPGFGNKGAEAAAAVVDTALLLRRLA